MQDLGGAQNKPNRIGGPPSHGNKPKLRRPHASREGDTLNADPDLLHPKANTNDPVRTHSH